MLRLILALTLLLAGCVDEPKGTTLPPVVLPGVWEREGPPPKPTLTSGIVRTSAATHLTAQERKMLDRSRPYIPMVESQIDKFWPAMPMRTFLRAQIEQESLWNPMAKLETKRELGRGFGQLTITSRFNAYEEVKAIEPALRDWDYRVDPFNPEKQVIAMLAKNRTNYRMCSQNVDGETEQMACVGVSYNGGAGGFQSDRRVCSNTQGCNPRLWFGHIEKTSLKQKTAQAGYGKSFFEINREYAVNVVFKRRFKYEMWG